jgi:hypothetical protein
LRFFSRAATSVASHIFIVELFMAYRSWFVMTPNEAKITENVLACLRLQADLTPAGMCAHGSNARMRLRAEEIRNACIRAFHGVREKKYT